MNVVIIGGGPAGFFAAIAIAENHPDATVTICEATKNPLAKVLVSGGGRCNVTNACFNPSDLVKFYPRGSKELRGPFHKFGPSEVIDWFEKRGVSLVEEGDGRMFPESDMAETIANCLLMEAKNAGVELLLETAVDYIHKDDDGFSVILRKGKSRKADKVILATGGSSDGHDLAKALGHTIMPIAPSLFTFIVRDKRIQDLSGVSVPSAKICLQVGEEQFENSGALLITHWGLSGPAILRLSAYAARALKNRSYSGKLQVSWTGVNSIDKQKELLFQLKKENPKQRLHTNPVFGLPKRLWQELLVAADIPNDMSWANCSKIQLLALSKELSACPLTLGGKGRFKDEFVTCGGISCKEINFKTMESRLVSDFYCIGEALDIDGLTGGFNFQNAWTTGFLAGKMMDFKG